MIGCCDLGKLQRIKVFIFEGDERATLSTRKAHVTCDELVTSQLELNISIHLSNGNVCTLLQV